MMDKTFALALGASLAACAASAAGPAVNLTQEPYREAIIGVDGTWGGGATKDKMFDGDTATFFDPAPVTTPDCWAGVSLVKAMVPTRVRYFGRQDNAHRPAGCLIEGSNDPDFADRTLLATINPPANWNSTSWLEIPLPGNTAAFKYLRIWSNETDGNKKGYGCGNLCELEFWGYDPDEAFETVLDPPVLGGSLFAIMNGRFTLPLERPSTGVDIETQRRARGGEWEPVRTHTVDQTPDFLSFTFSLEVDDAYDFRFRSRDGARTSAWADAVTYGPYFVPLAGTWIGTQGSYAAGRTGDRAYDGNVYDFVDGPNDDEFWTGLDFGDEQAVFGVRFVPRSEQIVRMVNSRFEVSNNANFTDDRENGLTNQVLHTVASSPPAWQITDVPLDAPVRGRYARWLGAAGSYGNVAEIEFYTAARGVVDAPKALAAALNDDFSIGLTWSNDGVLSAYDSVVVYRSLYASGPWEELAALPAGTAAWTDDSAELKIGPRYYYALAYRAGAGDGAVDGPKTPDEVSLQRLRQLERAPSDLTTLRPGVTSIHEGGYYGDGTNDDTKPFDGDPGTFCDLNTMDGAVGVDLGADNAYAVVLCRVARRPTGSDNVLLRLDGASLFGADALPAEGRWAFGAENLIVGDFPVTDNAYHEFLVPAENRRAWRYVYLSRPGREFYGNVGEIELYGCRAEDLDKVEFPALIDTPTPRAARAAGGGVTVSWDASAAPGATYDLARATAGGDDWTTLAEGLSETSFADAGELSVGGSYEYRVTVHSGGDAAAGPRSEPLFYYVAGAGDGLWARYGAPYHVDFGDSTPDAYRCVTNAAIDIWWGNSALAPLAAIDNVRVDWEGELEVPFADTYTFTLQSDDGAALFIDGVDVINNYRWVTDMPGSRYLSAGRHRITVHYWDNLYTAYCRLYWATARMPRELVPASQFHTPARPRLAVPEPWVDARPFNCSYYGRADFDEDGTLTIAGNGSQGFYNDDDSIMFVWRDVKGNFDCQFRYARVADNLPDNNCKVILLARNGLAPGAVLAAVDVNLNNGATEHVGFNAKYRAAPGALITDLGENGGYVAAPGGGRSGWLRLVRDGKTFLFYAKEQEGDPWIAVGSYTFAPDVELEGTLQVGVAAASAWDGGGNMRAFTVSDFTVRQGGFFLLVK